MGLVESSSRPLRYTDIPEPGVGDNEVSRKKLKAEHDLGAGLGIETKFGFLTETDWQNTVMWDTDPTDDMDDVESCRFFDPGDPLHPGDDALPPEV